MRFEPSSTIIDLFDGADGEPEGAKVVAKILECPVSRVRNWRREKGSNGTGGLIPHKYIAQLLAAAKRLDLDLQPGDFVTAERLQSMKSGAAS